MAEMDDIIPMKDALGLTGHISPKKTPEQAILAAKRAAEDQARPAPAAPVKREPKSPKDPYKTPGWEKALFVIAFCVLPFHAVGAIGVLVVLTLLGWQRKLDKVSNAVDRLASKDTPWVQGN